MLILVWIYQVMKILMQLLMSFKLTLMQLKKKEIELLRNEPLSQHELELVKSNMLGDLVKNNDTPFNMANNVGGMELYGIYPQYFNDHIAAIRAVTPEALLDVARRYFIPEELYVVVAGRMK